MRRGIRLHFLKGGAPKNLWTYFETTTWHLYSELKSSLTCQPGPELPSAVMRFSNGIKRVGRPIICWALSLQLNQMLFQASLSSLWPLGKPITSVTTCQPCKVGRHLHSWKPARFYKGNPSAAHVPTVDKTICQPLGTFTLLGFPREVTRCAWMVPYQLAAIFSLLARTSSTYCVVHGILRDFIMSLTLTTRKYPWLSQEYLGILTLRIWLRSQICLWVVTADVQCNN